MTREEIVPSLDRRTVLKHSAALALTAGLPATEALAQTPNIEIQVEPLESGKAVYLPLAATTAAGTSMVKIVLRLRLQNKSSSALKVNGIKFAFPGSSYAASAMQGVNIDGSLDLDAGEVAFWSNGRVNLDPDDDNVDNWINNSVYLTGAAPPQVKVEVSCKDIPNPATVTLLLTPHKSPVSGDAYRFPFAAGDLRKDEYFETSAVHWANGGPKGTQIFAHDIGVVGWDSNAQAWSGLLPNGDRLKNEDYRIWNKPVRAGARGTVEDWFDGMNDNAITADATGRLQFPADPPPQPWGSLGWGSGNYIVIRHGTEFVTCCHFRKGSIPEELKQKGAPVSEGQTLGRVGNTGRTTNPHTHIECERASDFALRPLPFRSASVVDRSKLSPPGASGPWFRLRGHGICKDAVSIWPASTAPGFPVPTVGISMGGDWANSFFIRSDLTAFQKTAQDLFDNQGRRLVRVTTFLESGARRWVGISRSGDWANQWWISPDLSSFQKTAQDLFDQKGLRLLYANSYVEGGTRKWIGISRGGDWGNRLIIKDDLASFSNEAQSLFDDHGLRLIHVMTWVEGSKRRWLGISRSGNWANRWWISPDIGHFSTKAQQLFDDEGKRLVHVTTYVEGNQRRWVGISRSGNWANRWFLRSDLDSFGLEAQRLFDDEHLRLVHAEPLE